MISRKTGSTLMAALAASLVCGCQRLDVEEFREALPEKDDLTVKIGAGDQEESEYSAYKLDQFAECDECCIESDTGGEQSYVSGDIYEMTRSAKFHVNGSLIMMLGWVKAIAARKPSEETDEGYIWGPWNENLSRIEFRFYMDKKTEEKFSFRLEGKNINDASGNWTSVLDGEVVPADAPHRGTGFLILDLTKIHEIDSSHPSRESGQLRYDFDVRQFPYTVDVAFDNFKTDSGVLMDAIYRYERYEGLAGYFHFKADADVTGPDDAQDGTSEVLDIESRWGETGEGKGEASVSGGSLGSMKVGSYALTECWADSKGLFYETYDYTEIYFTNGSDPIKEIGCGDSGNCPVF